jgi:hypothetical protein
MDEWDLTLEEKLAYLHLLATTPHQFIPPDLLTGHGTGFCKRFLKTPEEQKQRFDEFVESLRTDPKAQLVYQLILSCSPDEKIADAAYTAYWKEMWNQREEIVTQKVQVEEWTSSRPVPEERRRKHAREMLPLLHYYLTHVNNYRYWEYSWDIMWQPDQWSEEDAAAIWPEFLQFKERARADYLARGHRQFGLDELEQPFQKKFPKIAGVKAPGPAPEPLIVNRLWHPWLAPGSPNGPGLDVYITSWQIANNELWVGAWFASQGGDKLRLFEIRLPDFQATGFDFPEHFQDGGAVLATPEAVFLYNNTRAVPPPAKQGYISRFDLKTHTWETRPSDFSYLGCYAVKNSLYFDLLYNGLNSGIERYDWDTAKYTLLASSRRKPAQNQFDDNAGYMIQSIFAGPGGKPCVATLQNGTYYIQDQPGNWSPVFDSSRWTLSTTRQEKTLVFNPDGEVVLLDPTRAGPKYLMSPPGSRFRKAAANQSSEIPKTPWASQAQWDGTSLGQELVGGNADYFFVVRFPEKEGMPYTLAWFDKQHGRKGHIIPLKFLLDEKTYASLPPLYHKGTEPKFSLEDLESPGKDCNPSVVAVNEGICLCSDDLGIWFIPYSDIESYLNTHTAEELIAPPDHVVPAVKIPPPEDDAQSRVIGGMVDPGSPYISFR